MFCPMRPRSKLYLQPFKYYWEKTKTFKLILIFLDKLSPMTLLTYYFALRKMVYERPIDVFLCLLSNATKIRPLS